MLTRRTLMIGSALALTASAARAQDWKSKYPELVFAVVPAENATGVVDRWTPFVDYLSRELGTKVTLRVANDYAAVIEGQRAGNIQIAYYGPASFARARIIGVKTDAFAIDVNSDGSKGYYSVFYVLAKAPYQKIDDLKGKAMAFVDPNSTSGNNMPRFVLDRMGIDPDRSSPRRCSPAATKTRFWRSPRAPSMSPPTGGTRPTTSNLTRMLDKGMLKNADGSPMTKDDFRIILKSDIIINSPYAYLSDLPDDLKAAIAKAFLEAAAKDKADYDRLSDGKNQPWQPVANADYDKTIELVKFVDELRKKKS